MLKINTTRANQIGFNSDNFYGGIIYSDLPEKIYITRLEPISERGLNDFLTKLDKKRIKFIYSAPDKDYYDFFLNKGYYFSIDVAGLPSFSNYKPTKNIKSCFKLSF